MSVTESTPYGRPAQTETFVVMVTLGEGMHTPNEVLKAITESIHQYGMARKGTLTPFAQQPGYPLGDIKNEAGVIVGEWHLQGGV